MAFDYKKEYKEFYMPKNMPSILRTESTRQVVPRRGNIWLRRLGGLIIITEEKQ